MKGYTAHVNQHKKDTVARLADYLKNINGYIFTDYRGASVSQMNEVRVELQQLGVSYHVIKNRFALRAFEEVLAANQKNTTADQLLQVLRGPTALAGVQDNSHAVLKYFISIDKVFPISLKGAILSGVFHGREEIRAIASLPSREELLAKLLRTLQESVRRFPALLYQIVSSPLRVMQSIIDQKEK